MASPGNGTPQHLSGELFKTMAGVSLIHVPYRGDAPALTDLIGGQVQVSFSGMVSSIEYIRTGKVRALAITTATPRFQRAFNKRPERYLSAHPHSLMPDASSLCCWRHAIRCRRCMNGATSPRPEA
jgi:Tripartite tricarboxylate transporter family receptor